ncbi:MAG: hypothetical protein ABSF72_16580 [Candidatus Sulfotelmatobacter sp.]
MPLTTTFYNFNEQGIELVNEVGGVYGLAVRTSYVPSLFTILYVGLSGNLRERLQSHLNDPPTTGITHFFVERIDNLAARAGRERQLIAEFRPVANTHHK